MSKRRSPKKQTLTYDEWAKIGSDLKKIQNSLYELWFHSDLRESLTKDEKEKGFLRVERGLRKTKQILAKKMIGDIGEQYSDLNELVLVIYGSSSGLEPLPEPKRKDKDGV